MRPDPEPIRIVRSALGRHPLDAHELQPRCGFLHCGAIEGIADWLVRHGEAEAIIGPPTRWRITPRGWSVRTGLTRPHRRPL